MSVRPLRRCLGGITLVEQIVFIIIVSVGVIGVLSTLGPSLMFSADPQVKKQQLAIAESILAEILHQPFTYCDPDDANAATATLSGGVPTCAGTNQDNGGGTLGAVPGGETRFGAAAGTQFDNVADYAGYSQTGITNVTGASALAGFTVNVAINRIGATYGLPPGAALRVDVTVSGGSPDALTLSGYRFRYAPRY